MNKQTLGLVLVCGLSAAACGTTTTKKTTTMQQPTAAPERRNPLTQPSALYLSAPPFDQVRIDDFRPAYEAGMREQLAEVRAIADDKSPPTFDNTIVAMEKSGAMLDRVNKVFGHLAATQKNAAMQQIETEMSPKLAAFHDKISLDAPLFARIQALYDKRASLGLDPISVRLIERYHLDFVRSGAMLSDADKKTLSALNEEESKLMTSFDEHLLKETNASALVVDKVAELDGLSPADVDAAASAAKARKLEGKWVIPLINTTEQPLLKSLTNRAVRERLFRASVTRCSHGGENDTRAIITRLAQLRAQRAKLLGFPDFASFTLADQMAKTPDAAGKLLDQLAKGAVARAKQEVADMQAVVDKAHGGFKIQPWDWAFYSEKVRKAKYDLDEAEQRPFFELDHVLKDGVFFAAHELYGVSFKQRTDLPVYDPNVRVFEVLDADGSTVGLIYTDYFARESKRGGAWMESLVDQSDLIGSKPVVVNCLNIAKPAPGAPVLLTFDEVTTMFHEFGHALHGLFSKSRYPYFSGTRTPRDFVEFPSQFNENWALELRVLASYAKQHDTGAPMPAALVAKIKKSTTFNEGFATLESTAGALLDLDWHSLPPTAALQDAEKFEAASLHKHGVDLPQVPPRYHSAYFTHVWSGGYSAGYYAYMWTAVLASDAYAWFDEHGGMTAANGKAFREAILSRGGTVDAHDLYLAFRGHEPSVEPLMKKRGLVAGKQR